MKIPSNGRYLKPSLREATARWWGFDDLTPGSAADFLTGSSYDFVQLASEALPLIVPGATGMARQGDGSSRIMVVSPTDFAAQTILKGNFTLHVIFRLLSDGNVGDNTMICCGGTDSAVASENILLALQYVQTAGPPTDYRRGVIPKIRWEYGAGNQVVSQPSNFVIPWDGRWTMITLRRSGTTLDLFSNGLLVESFTGLTLPDTGNGASWTILGRRSTAATGMEFAHAEVDDLQLIDGVLTDDAILEDARNFLMLPFWPRADVKAEVTDANGDRRETTCLDGVDFLDSISWTENQDGETAVANISFLREQGNLSIAPFNELSPLNLTDRSDPESFDSLVKEGREIEAFVARVPLFIEAEWTDFFSVFLGDIEDVDSGAEAVRVNCKDIAGRLIRAHMEDVYSYGANPPVAVQGELQDMVDNFDSTALTDGYDPFTLYWPVAPNWDVLTWTQRREAVLAALKTAVGQIGWDMRLRWDPLTQAWRLTGYEPDRLQDAINFALSPDDVLEIPSLKTDIRQRRNVVRILYPSSEDPVPLSPSSAFTVEKPTTAAEAGGSPGSEGNRLTAILQLRDAASSAEFKRLFMEIAEAATSQIDTQVEALRMAEALMRDVSQQELAGQFETGLLAEAETHDMGLFTSNRQLYSTAQRLALFSVTHTIDARGAKSMVNLRGKPSVGYRRWLHVEARNGIAPPPITSPGQLDNSDHTIRQKIAPAGSLLTGSMYFTGGDAGLLKNGSFEKHMRGATFPPDSWNVQTDGLWSQSGGGSSRFSLELADTRIGGRSIRIATALNLDSLWSDPIPVSGRERWSLYAVAKALGAITEIANMDLVVHAYGTIEDAYRFATPISSTTYNLPAVYTATPADGWIRWRQDGVGMLPGAAAVRIAVRRSVAGLSDILLDQVQFYRTPNSCDARLSADVVGAATGAGPWDTGWVLVPFNNDSTGGAFDYLAVFDTANNYLEAYESGEWKLRLGMEGGISLLSLSTLDRLQLRIQVDRQGAGFAVEEFSPGSEVDEIDLTAANRVIYDILKTDIALDAGDRVKLECRMQGNATGSAQPTFFATRRTSFKARLERF